MKKLIRGFFCFSAFAMLLTGCSQHNTGTGTLKVGVRDDIVGFSYLNPNTGEYYGLEIDLASELAKELGFAEVEFTTVNPENRKDMLLEGNVDCLIAMYSIEESRLENFDFSPAYYVDNTSILVEASSLIHTVEDLTGKNIGVLQGANSAPKLASYMKEKGMISDADLKGTSLTYEDTYIALSDALEEGLVDAVCTDGGIAKAYQKDDRKILEETVGTESYGVATGKGSQLSEKISQAVQTMIDDGRIAAILDKWN